MSNKDIITWTSGDATGFYIDFKLQTVGYNGEQKHLEYLQTKLLQFMLTAPDDFKTSRDVSEAPEIFSINLSKYIHEIKNKCIAILKNEDLFEQIIERKTINGKRGYRLHTEFTDMAAGTVDLIAKSTDTDNIPFITYIKNNWFPLFIYLFLILSVVLVTDSAGLSPGDLLTKVLELPFAVSFLSLCILAALPIIGGILIDARNSHFDNSKEHIIFFLVCNLTGAFTVASEVLYAKSIKEALSSNSQSDWMYVIIAVGACFVALYNNYMLQTKDSAAREKDHYILTRAHAFLNLVHLSIGITIGAMILYDIFLSKVIWGNLSIGITAAYIVMYLSGYCYLWFSSDSPAAEKIDSISNNNFISGIPIVALSQIIYTFACFKLDLLCVVSIMSSLLFTGLWAFYLVRRKRHDSLKFKGIYTSFFSIIAAFVIISLLMNVFYTAI